MEISKLSPNGVKIKTKTTLLAVNPFAAKGKVEVDAVLLLQHTYTPADLSLNESTVIVNGPGEYEVKGTKLSGFGRGEDVAYVGRMEGVPTFCVKASSLTKSKDLMQDCSIIILDTDTMIENSLIATSNAQVIVLYGEHAEAIAKQLGKEVAPTTKYTVTKDKLPSETEVVVLQ